jgi:hypothetical protein
LLPETDVQGCKAFFVFDEVSLLNLFDPELFVALRRVLGLLKSLPIWALLLDTASSLELLAPADENDGSSRVMTGGLQRVQPFLALDMDLELRRCLQDPELKAKELRKPLSDYGTVAHMSRLGRPLWAIYRRFDNETVREYARMKILGGRQSFQPESKHHVFALLAVRVCLTPCIRNTEANQLSQVAVSLHLRLISSTDLRHGRTLTVTPSEPLVSEAAAFFLRGNWPAAIQVFTKYLLAPGLIDPGLSGEPFARILFIMAKDATAESEVEGEKDGNGAARGSASKAPRPPLNAIWRDAGEAACCNIATIWVIGLCHNVCCVSHGDEG